MQSKDIECNIKHIFENYSKNEFIFEFLIAYGISKTSVTRLKKGDFNLSKVQGEVLYKKKVLFKEEESDKLLISIESLSTDERVLKHSPRFVIVTDFKTLLAKDLKLGTTKDIQFSELPRHYDFFLPLAGSEVYVTKNDNKADRDAAYKMAELYDSLITANRDIYTSKESIHSLNIFLSRLLFCFFAEDTGIFEENSIFTNSLAQHTQPDGSDTHLFLNELFKRLNSKSSDEFPMYLAEKFPYVNGGLFRDPIESPKFTSKARNILIGLGELQWQEINPDIFGSMIQAVVLPEYRSDLGMHYTSVENILKLIRPLFLDELYEEFEKHRDNVAQLRKLIARMSKMKFFDPACGSGNFLIITYKELRALEIEILQHIIEIQTPTLLEYTEIKLSQFYGIELDDFAHEMARLSLWLAEHQMNKFFEERLAGYGESRPILPLREAGHIVQGNSCREEWKEVCPIGKDDEVYIIGNPPYQGSRKQNNVQKEDLRFVFGDNYKSLDYISAWFYKGARYIVDMNAKCAFVSTNSICQGDQARLNWPRILSEHIEIGYAYQSFKWINNAKGNAGVTVIIVGLRNTSAAPKYLITNNIKKLVKDISPYLKEQSSIVISAKSSPISSLPEMKFGNMPNDGGNLILSEEERNKLPNLTLKWVKNYCGSADFIRGEKRYCLWIPDNELYEVKKYNMIKERLDKVTKHREKSSEKSTRAKSGIPNHFYFSAHKDTDSILIPRHSSESRPYIPIGFFDSETIIADSAMAVYNALPWHFAVITSRMHMVWVRAVGGRLKTDYRYSAKLCYNTFPFPNITEKQKENLNLYVFAILDERAKYPSKTMAQLYDPEIMPIGLRQAHKELDEAIERCYRLQPFANDTERLEYLFKLYEEMTTKETLFAKPTKRKKRQ
ncbi:N-6 DNA methylase [Bacteroides fragilis]|nr:N-6 DNA methylase [Bacteroides fragilis]